MIKHFIELTDEQNHKLKILAIKHRLTVNVLLRKAAAVGLGALVAHNGECNLALVNPNKENEIIEIILLSDVLSHPTKN